jgi:hypothetical protein
VLGEASGIAAHLSITEKKPLRKISTPILQKLLVERKAVVTYFDDLRFDDPDFAAFQWLGARGLNKGYNATPDKILTQADIDEIRARIPGAPNTQGTMRQFAKVAYAALAPKTV